jgi:hypothetical protein
MERSQSGRVSCQAWSGPDLRKRPLTTRTRSIMRSILLMFLGVPLPIILLLAFCTHHF